MLLFAFQRWATLIPRGEGEVWIQVCFSLKLWAWCSLTPKKEVQLIWGMLATFTVELLEETWFLLPASRKTSYELLSWLITSQWPNLKILVMILTWYLHGHSVCIAALGCHGTAKLSVSKKWSFTYQLIPNGWFLRKWSYPSSLSTGNSF